MFPGPAGAHTFPPLVKETLSELDTFCYWSDEVDPTDTRSHPVRSHYPADVDDYSAATTGIRKGNYVGSEEVHLWFIIPHIWLTVTLATRWSQRCT